MPALPIQSFCSGFWYFSVPNGPNVFGFFSLSRRLMLRKSFFVILESGYYLHHKSPAILYSFDYYKEKSMINYCIIVP